MKRYYTLPEWLVAREGWEIEEGNIGRKYRMGKEFAESIYRTGKSRRGLYRISGFLPSMPLGG